tara:strand:+ start:202 stop:351 length:150 start_codon:yes stop_codon:yes gene_type:complete
MKNNWSLSFGSFPGILFGVRTYVEEYRNNHVLYLGFVDICLTVFKNERT